MTSLFNNGGFTLIELLVVVLIIGILAAVAVPQYKKAVMKSRLAQWDVMFNAARKAIDLYLLENGFPESNVFVTGKNSPGTVEMPGHCDDCCCFMSAGGVGAFCGTSECLLLIDGSAKADGMYTNKALGDDFPYMQLELTPAGDSYISGVGGKAGCQWVAERHPDIPVVPFYIARCKNDSGVTLPNPEYTE